MRFRILVILSILPVLLLVQACSKEDRVTVHVGEVAASVELALTADERSVGLMHRKELGEDQGLLMVFPRPRVVRIWMLNTKIPLDIGYFDKMGRLLDYTSMEPDGGKRVYRSPETAIYALEMNRGWFENHGIKAGHSLRLPYPIVGE